MGMELALKRLPWYIAFFVVLGPLLAAPFTAGLSLAWYYFYFARLWWMGTWIPVGVGFSFWAVRMFIFAFARHWFRDHLQRTEAGRVLSRS